MSEKQAATGVGWDEFTVPKPTRMPAHMMVTLPAHMMATITKPSEWTAHVCGGWYTFTPPKGQEPNAFHRLMQRLAFGVVWKRRADKP